MPSPPHPPELPPLYDLDSERACLGALLIDREAVIGVAPWLRAEHFYLERHARIYAAVLACYQQRTPPDLATVIAHLQARDELARVGGASALAELTALVPTALHVEHYGRAVEAMAVRRLLVEGAGRVAAAGYDPDPDLTTEARIERAAAVVAAVAAGRSVDGGFVSAEAVASEYLARAQALPDDAGGMLGLPTGYVDLDAITKGLKPGELVVLAARPGQGKTTLALCVSTHVAGLGEGGVGIFSLEMDRELLMNRLVAARIGVDSTRVPSLVRRGDVRAIEALAAISALPLYIDHTPALNPVSIRARAQRLASEVPIALWVVDYLQLAQSGRDRDDEYQRVTAVSRGLTELARATRTPILALSQMSREVERRGSKVPQLSDLRGSGAIEQDASQVWFIHRDEGEEAEVPVTEIHVAKHRNGETGIAPLFFDRISQRFQNLERYRAPIGYDGPYHGGDDDL